MNKECRKSEWERKNYIEITADIGDGKGDKQKDENNILAKGYSEKSENGYCRQHYGQP